MSRRPIENGSIYVLTFFRPVAAELPPVVFASNAALSSSDASAADLTGGAAFTVLLSAPFVFTVAVAVGVVAAETVSTPACAALFVRAAPLPHARPVVCHSFV